MAADVHPEVELLTAVALLMRTVRTFSHLRSQQLGPPGATLGVLTGAAGTAAPGEHASRLSRHGLSRDCAGVLTER